ncbi:MAG: hypothetical protein M3324_02905, partial [Actinomycetota bacterium]|nr:hypothetical protein [Actinomycetota bacterium]
STFEYLDLDLRTARVAPVVHDVTQAVAGTLSLLGGLLDLPSMPGELLFVVGRDLFPGCPSGWVARYAGTSCFTG